MDLPPLKLDERGLVTVVAQDHRSGEVRMVAHADEEALRQTLSTGQAHFFSRSRGRLWKKGESSGHVLRVRQVWLDCDADAVVYLVEPRGPSCHTGRRSCFFDRLDSRPADPATDAAGHTGASAQRAAKEESSAARAGETAASGARALPILAELELALERRRGASAERSYTRSLLEAGSEKIGAKLREEAEELATALAEETDERVVSEAADVVYHLMVALLDRDLPLSAVQDELARRFGVSGHEEKASRG